MSSSLSQMRGGKRTRPLGSLRQMIPPDEKVQLPRLNSLTSRGADEEKLDEKYGGIQGNAMTLPTPKEASRPEDRRKSLPQVQKEPSVPKSASASSASGVSHEACEKEMKEAVAREKDLKERIAQLQKQVELLTAQVSEKDQVIQNLGKDLQAMEEDYKKKLEEEQAGHAVTQQNLQSTQTEMEALLSKLEAQEKEAKEKMDLIRLDLTRQMTEMAAQKDKEIADRDQKLNRLKMQMADALKGNSWERQQQLEELTKDLARIQEECDMLRGKLKSLSKTKPGHCQNCAEATSRAEKLALTLKEREVTVKDLKSLCAKFEKQLSQQDQLLKMFAESKGHKVTLPK